MGRCVSPARKWPSRDLNRAPLYLEPTPLAQLTLLRLVNLHLVEKHGLCLQRGGALAWEKDRPGILRPP